MGTYYFSGHFVGDKVKAGKEHLKWAFENAPGTSNAYHTTNSENSKKTDVVNGPEYAATLDQSSTSSQRAASFSSSVGSIQRDGSLSELDNSFRRWRRANCSANLGYETVVFDASSTYSTRSQVSATSTSSGRLGPLSSLARSGMNAVIKVGACWRCRFLRKPCDPISPCGLCPKGNKSGWEVVGCKRGSFKAAMLPITLCPKATTVVTGSPAQLPDSSTSHETSSQPDVAANTFFRDTMNRREMALARLVQATEYSAEDDPILHDMEIRPLLRECLPGNCTPIKQPGLAALNPLNECILAIAWELFDYPFSCFDITETGDLGGLVRLLPSVARYQAKHQSELNSDQLIAQSLICLRSCLEALRIKASGFLGKQRHVSCNSGLCKFECLEYVKLNISLYFDELSRVFFKKENMRNKTTWWLSAFYSFCIQSFVRRALLELEKESLVFATLASRDYLRDPVQLFVAISSLDDPLIRPLARDLSGKVKTNAMVEGPNLDDYEEARLAVGQNTWLTDGISGSYDYLTSLFGDQKVGEQSTTNGSPRDSLEF
ncbi:hypothetical protein BKA61DRAFT_607420 [Leptodontidium sp. MPI-SDFR-AT-0119]|nr:hypothetical protein BKA61DRAFT_607420 [Leptodontidium sp. MPI-SDFR-AT-0119]